MNNKIIIFDNFIKNWRENDEGFSLLELVTGVGIVLILTLVGLMSFNGLNANARQGAVNEAVESVYSKAMALELDSNSKTNPKDVETEYNASSDNVRVEVNRLGSGRLKVTATYSDGITKATRVTPFSGSNADNGENDTTIPEDETPIIAPSSIRSVFNIRCEEGQSFTQVPFDNAMGSVKIVMTNLSDTDAEPEEVKIGKEFTEEEYDIEYAKNEKMLRDNFDLIVQTYDSETLKQLMSQITGKTYTGNIVFEDYLELNEIANAEEIQAGGYSSYLDYSTRNSHRQPESTKNVVLNVQEGVDYQLLVDGRFGTISGDKSCLQGIETIGNGTGLTKISQLGKLIKDVPESIPSTVTNLQSAFSGAKYFNDSNVSKWDVSNVTNTSFMFSGTSNFNQSLSNWETGNITSMRYMFSSADSFDQDVSMWDVSEVTTMDHMFRDARVFDNGGKALDWNNLEQLKTTVQMFSATESISTSNPDQYVAVFNQDISSWNAPNLKQTSSMFAGNKKFNNGKGEGEPGSLHWNIGQPEDFSRMFAKASSFNQNLDSWDMSKVTNMNSMFSGATKFNNGDEPSASNKPLNWNVESVTDISYLFNYTSVFNQYVGSLDTSKVTKMNYVFQHSIKFNNGSDGETEKPLSWNTSNVTEMKGMFNRAYYFNQSLDSFDTSKVTDMSNMFSLSVRFNQSLAHFDTSNVVYMLGTFADAQDFNQNLNSWNTEKVTDMSFMFSGKYSTTAFTHEESSGRKPGYGTTFNNGNEPGVRGETLNWDTRNVTNMREMFYAANNFNQDLSHWNVGKVNTVPNTLETVTPDAFSYKTGMYRKPELQPQWV